MRREDIWKRNTFNNNITEKYTIEYVDDAKTWDNIVNEKYKNPWEWYKIKEYDNVWDAIETYIKYMIHSSIYDVKCYKQLFLDGKLIMEETIQFSSTFMYELKRMINNEVVSKNNNLQKNVDELMKINELYKEFIKKYNADQLFKDFLENKIAEV